MPTPVDQKRDATLVFFGICIWDYLTSLWFEYRLITRKTRFRWQFVPYFMARYFVLALVIMSAVNVIIDTPMRSACSRAVSENVILHLGLLALVFGTWNLLTRTLIIWGHHPLLMKILSVVGLTHLALALILSSVGRDPCTSGPPSVLSVAIFGSTTASIEFVILLLCLIGIRRASTHGESHLARILKAQGIAYFVMAFLIQMSTIAICLAHTDDATRMWVGVSGSILSPILSCRLVTSTLSQDSAAGDSLGSRTHRIECFELSEGQGQNPSIGRITTCIDIETTTKDEGVC